MMLQPSTRTAPAALIESARREIQELLLEVSGVDSVLLCSPDGFELASVHKQSKFDGHKLAAVSSSILAMVTAFVSEIKLTGCQSITLEANNGKAIISAVPASNHPMIIVVVASSHNVLLGQLIHSLKKHTAAIVDIDRRYR